MEKRIPMTAEAMLTIPAEPCDYAPSRAGLALIIIDMQRDFLEPGGFGAALGNDVSHLRSSIAPTARLLAGFRAAGLPVFHTRECHLPDLSDCPPSKRRRGPGPLRIGDAGPMGRILIQGQPGAAIIPELAPEDGEVVIDKPGKGAFHATPLMAELEARRITHLVFAGVTTEVCVQTTMREANDRGFDCLLAIDATDSYFPAFKAATIAMITAQAGIVGWAAPVDAILTALEASRP